MIHGARLNTLQQVFFDTNKKKGPIVSAKYFVETCEVRFHTISMRKAKLLN